MFKNIILTLPFFATFFWAVTLWIGVKSLGPSKKVLAVFMTSSALLYASHIAFFTKDYRLYSLLDPIYTLTNLSVFPLFYLYIRSLTNEKAVSFKSLWVLTPSILFFITSIIVYLIIPKQELQYFIHVHLYKEIPIASASTPLKVQIFLYNLTRIVFAIQLIPCTYFSWSYIREYELKIKEFYSATEERSLSWTGNLLIATILSAAFSLILTIIGKSFFADGVALIVIPSVLFSTLLYSIGYFGYNQAFSIRDYQKDLLADKVTRNHNSNDTLKSKLYTEIIRILEEGQIFRNPDLRITDISRILKTNRTYISSIINSEFDSSFCDLINHYRIDYSKRLLLHQSSYILEYISSESGFASVNSFLRAFKKETGITPGQYRKQLQRI